LQIKEGKYEFPSPYWDSVGDPALDLIEHMLEVNPNRRITVDQALRHPWVTEEKFDPAASCDSLVGALETMGLKRTKVIRERTLLAEHPSMRPFKKPLVAAHQEDAGKEKAAAKPAVKEVKPSDVPANTKAFMHVGGKGGDETLYGDSYSSIASEVPSEVA
jgi:serine/threonine-protein kinase CHEK2